MIMIIIIIMIIIMIILIMIITIITSPPQVCATRIDRVEWTYNTIT